MKKIFSLLIIITSIFGSAVSPAAVRNQWNMSDDFFKEITRIVVQPESIIKIDNNYINPKAITAVKVMSQFSVEIILDNNSRYMMAFKTTAETIEFLNTILILMK